MLGAVSAMAGRASAQIITTHVQDTVHQADGTAATGTVLISWPSFTTAGGSAVPAGSTSVTIGSGGALNVQLVPNAGSTPIGSYYTVVYHLGDGSVTHEYWVVPAQTGATTLSAIRSSVLPTSVAMQTVSKSYVDTAIATAMTAHPADTVAEPYVLRAGDTMTGPLVLPADPTAPLQASDKQYVDAQVAAVAAGLNQKVSTLPSASQTVTQPTGTNLAVNILNGVEYASQYVSGAGNNGIANATASSDCTTGCTVVAEPNYASTEVAAPATWNDKTRVTDERDGATFESFLNPAPRSSPGLQSAKSVHVVSTDNIANILAATGVNSLVSTGLAITNDALAGGSNVNPAHIQTTVPYGKSTYGALTEVGTNYTLGQHILSGQSQDCYGVGDCLMGGIFMRASGGFRDETDEGSHPFDLNFTEDPRVFEGTCSTGCSTGSTLLQIAPTANAGTQGEGRYLIDLNPAKTLSTGTLTGGVIGGRQPSATFSGTSFPVSTLLETAQAIPTQATNISPGTVTFAIVTSGVPSGFATNTAALPAPSGVACVSDVFVSPAQAMNFESASYTVVDSSHLQMTLLRPHANGATIAVGGLCGYGLEQTVDTASGIRQVFPVVASTSATSLLYAGGGTQIVGQQAGTSAYANVNLVIASIARSGNVVTVTTASNLPEDLNGLSLTVQGVTDSSYNGTFNVTTTGPNSLTYSETGANSTSAGGTVSLVTGGFVLYPMTEVVSVYNATTKAVDGQMTLTPNTVAWAAGDAVEMPHYFQEHVHADTEYITQTTPRPNQTSTGGINYGGNVGPGLVGWNIQNSVPASAYFGNGGTHTVPGIGMAVGGVWNHAMELQAGENAAITVHCNSHGCNKWNSSYDLFQMDTSVGQDRMNYSPATSTLNFSLRGTNYQFTPSGLTLGTLNVTNLNATNINGSPAGGGSGSVTQAAISSALTNTTYNNFIVGVGAGTPTSGVITGGGGDYGDSNVLVGPNAGAAITTAREMTVLGANACQAYAGYAGSTPLNQTENGLATCIGSQAGSALLSTGFDGSGDDVFLGQKAGTNTINGQACTYLGTHTGTALTDCINSTVAGGHSLNDSGTGGFATGVTVFGAYSADGTGNKTNDTVVGEAAAPVMTTASSTNCFGQGACPLLTTGSNNEVSGPQAAPGLVAGTANVIIGPSAGPSADTSSITVVGAYAANGVTSAVASTVVGNQAITRGGTLSLSTLVGDSVGEANSVALNSVTVVGGQAGLHLTANNATGLFGAKAGVSLTTGSNNNFFGNFAGAYCATCSQNTAMGDYAGSGMTGSETGNESFGAAATTAAGVSNAAQIGNGTNPVSGSLQFNSTQIIDGQQNLHASVSTPAQGSTCTAGAIVVNSGFIYVCVAANTWQRAALNVY
jgi:hypothetical protein